MFQTFRNAWKIPELKNRLLFTLAILVVYRLGCAIPVPFITGSALSQMFSNGNMLSYLDMMSGGALSRCTLFALGGPLPSAASSICSRQARSTPFSAKAAFISRRMPRLKRLL